MLKLFKKLTPMEEYQQQKRKSDQAADKLANEVIQWLNDRQALSSQAGRLEYKAERIGQPIGRLLTIKFGDNADPRARAFLVWLAGLSGDTIK